jgi:hypothetical protein
LDTFQQLFYAELQTLSSEAASKQALNTLRGEVETLRDDHVQVASQCRRAQSGQEAVLQQLQEKSQRSEAATQECLIRINAELRALYDEKAAKSGEEAKRVQSFIEQSKRAEAAAQEVLSNLRGEVMVLSTDLAQVEHLCKRARSANDAMLHRLQEQSQKAEAATQEDLSSLRASIEALTGDYLKAWEEISQVKKAQDAWMQRSETATEESLISLRAEPRALNEQATRSEEEAKGVQSFTPENCIKVEDSEIPPFVRELLEKDKAREESDAQERADKLAMMHIRVYYESKEKLFSVKREDTLEDLKRQVIEAFGLTSDLQNARLRGYSVYLEVLKDTYDEAKTFWQLGIYNFKSMGLEVKSESEEFLDYDPNSIVLKVYNWDDAITEQPEVSIAQKAPEAKRVFISRSSTVRALMTQLESSFDIPVDQQRLLKKGFVGTSNFVETVSSRLNMDQSLDYARVYEGSILYLERIEETRSKSRW